VTEVPVIARSRSAHLGHLARRFLGALSPAAPGDADAEWAEARLTEPERAVFAAMANHDRRHAIGVARRAVDALGPAAPEDVAAAALLHDVGKVHARLGPVGRALATVRIARLGRSRVRDRVTHGDRARRRAIYADHAAIGAADLRSRGARARVAGWAAVHHDPSRWSESGFESAVTAALHAADDD
jgi:putative nucleotidyltransferase with HDIG domain